MKDRPQEKHDPVFVNSFLVPIIDSGNHKATVPLKFRPRINENHKQKQ